MSIASTSASGRGGHSAPWSRLGAEVGQHWFQPRRRWGGANVFRFRYVSLLGHLLQMCIDCRFLPPCPARLVSLAPIGGRPPSRVHLAHAVARILADGMAA
ncbi:unnamed protein product [Prorocentrum cordatum]|uniref:Uncharacterized protein n=1 Tax=Prorocentrum cordatum TaxID=2364126 RepID=A0ABN9VQ45_9DINO|nr:unnamed protein product [Polarella glacialis]